jgi:large subunit ribosomal protein L9
MHIADALKEKGYEIDRRRVHLSEPIKETGEYTVSVRLHREVNVEIPVTVTGEGGAQTANAAPAAPEAVAAAEAPSGGDGPNDETTGEAEA